MSERQSTNSSPSSAFLPKNMRKETAYRLNKYLKWMNTNDLSWLKPDLVAYRDYLLSVEGLSDSTVAAHLSTVRRRYRDLMSDRQEFVLLAEGVLQPGQSLDDCLFAILQAIDPATAPVASDPSPKAILRGIEYGELRFFLDTSFGSIWWVSHKDITVSYLKEQRDHALMDLMLETGIRESEVIRLKVEDLQYELGLRAALRIKQIRGSNVRLAPYLEGSIPVSVSGWVASAGLQPDDWLFQTFHRGGYRLRKGGMKLAAVRQIFERYPYTLEGENTIVITSTDLRAAYAWEMQRRGESTDAITQYLGASESMVNHIVATFQNRSESQE